MKNTISAFEKRIHGVFSIAIARKLRTCVGAVMALAFLLASPMASSAGFTVNTTTSPMTGLWWNQNESGWGTGLTQQYGIIFATLYTYDSEGKPTWYVASNCAVSADGCTGDLYAVTGGSALTVPWNGTNKIVAPVGTINFAFTDTNTGTMNYTINGVAGSKAITRQVFATAPVQTGGFPFDFKGVRVNSITFIPNIGFCSAKLSFTNVSGVAVSVFLYFDAIVDGITTGPFPFFAFGLAPGATAIRQYSPIPYECGTFTFQFNPAVSDVL